MPPFHGDGTPGSGKAHAMKSIRKATAAGGWLLLVTVGSLELGAAPALEVLRGAASGRSLLTNGGFEASDGAALSRWNGSPQGYRIGAGEGRNGSRALVCENATGKGWHGASQSVQFQGTQPSPLRVRGWSRAENVSGSADSDYALYVDIVYADGTPLWGQVATFPCGTHDWQQRELTLLPEKPVRTLTLHCLFRNRSGKVWFDDVAVEELQAGEGAVLFQGVAVRLPEKAALPLAGGRQTFAAGAVRLEMAGQAVAALSLAGRSVRSTAPGGFMVRDAAADSSFHGFENGRCAELGLELRTEFSAGRGIEISGSLSNSTGKDRAVTLVFALPVEAAGWWWGDDLHRRRRIEGRGEYLNQVAVRCGSTGTMSLYPAGAVWSTNAGLAIGLSPDRPAVYRVGYHAGTRQLFIAYDLALVADTERFPSGAEFGFVVYGFDGLDGFRGAWDQYMVLHPEAFRVRSARQGLWMPFTDVSKVEGWQDFGFRYHEGDNNVPWDDAHDVLSFRYTEPMTWWMPMPKETPRTPAEASRIRDELARGNNPHSRRMAEVSRLAGMHDDAGQPSLRFQDTPWCNGAVWSLNPNPGLAAPAPTNAPAAALNAATVYWNAAIKQRLYGPAARGQLDGEYLDSLEGYVTADLNFRREHFRASTVPLTFSADTRQPVLFKGLAVFEFTRWMSEDLHAMNKLLFANGVPYRFGFLCPLLDVLGTETDWMSGGKYRPASLAQMDLWRALSGAKPYLLLMNTDYDRFSPDLVEKYFHRCLFYGMWPGFFSHNAAENPYWQAPKWYNRDRPLFRKFIPLVRRAAEAGWRPLTHASLDNPSLLAERFGPDPSGVVFLTLYNDTAQPQTGTVRVDWARLGFAPDRAAVRELMSGETITLETGSWAAHLPAQEARLYELRSR